MAWLHTWVGLLMGWLLYFMFVTGTLGYVDTEIDRWMRPELPAMQATAAAGPAAAHAQAYLQAHAADAQHWTVRLPVDRNEPWLRVAWQDAQGGRHDAFLDATTGARITVRDTGGGQALYQMHWRLHYLPVAWADSVVAIASIVLLLAIVTGVVVHRRIFTDFFTLRFGKGPRTWLDLHNIASVMALPFQAMIAYSGLVFLMFATLPLVGAAWYGPGESGRRAFSDALFPPLVDVAAAGRPASAAPWTALLEQVRQGWGGESVTLIEVTHPGDAHARVVAVGNFAASPLREAAIVVFDGVDGRRLLDRSAWRSSAKGLRDLMLGLHEGLFVDPWVRLLYVLSGCLGAGMIATGLVLWTSKRRQQAERLCTEPPVALRAVERLNVAAVAGLAAAIAAYFWANRLLPADLLERSRWEMHAMFAAWGVMLMHAIVRPPRAAWREQAALAALAFGLLPVINACTTGQHLLRTLMAGDWSMAGFDLVALGVGLGLIWVLNACPGARRRSGMKAVK